MSDMIFEQVRNGGCLSYIIGCPETHAAILIDPNREQSENYLALVARNGLRVQYVLDTHTHADHFSSSQSLSKQLGVPVIMHRNSVAPFVGLSVDDGESVKLGKLRLNILSTPGHTEDSMCIVLQDRIFTGDTLLIGGTGRTDLPTGDPDKLYDSLFNGILQLAPDLKVFPAHDYRNQSSSTLAQEMATNPRLRKKERSAFVEQMRALDLEMPTHLTEALRTNRSGAITIDQLISDAAAKVSFMSMQELRRRLEAGFKDLVVLDVREGNAYTECRIPGALSIPRGQLELRVNELLPDPTQRIVVYCELGKISTLAAATLHEIGFRRTVALDGGFQAWKQAGYPLAPST